ncbi:thiamine ABC transporter ATP-binding protein [Canicola haemoglobinophilus]|uniref:Thiamine ABC transporter ATP-binding protein n=1 Tax=Canicola haemoglobinophilus TaxID=733 RepID=A0A1V4B0C9_9PAST|nr:thiamine ABC transporter ATP-binding protein [Canicola haemoglobinophilus]OOR99636.1 thiamine ABC transporter ATP-binding protein [Canicola haemoglobinophilus]STO53512.1 thiamine ABC transporter ATP-binding protein [Canicola haemoglobinophilus]STO61086.1 thiamine ABC transporter ATP-binding protein [Canicola haemoglobinophilus]STO68046.1 thiamine ABC transporter ATP-binding protein [Canicola haemoglobinophilus]
MIKLNATFAYPNVSMHFDLYISAGEKIAIIGESGSGKSTLLNLIAGFELVNQGEIWLNGENHTYTAPHQRPVSILFQEHNLFTHLTVWQNIALGLTPDLKLNKAQINQLEQVASAVGLTDFLSRLPKDLSGGQRQRVALARCLLRDKPILLLDEPFSALDPNLRQEMLALIDELCREKQLTLLLVTHQPNEVMNKIDRIIEIKNGQMREMDVSR